MRCTPLALLALCLTALAGCASSGSRLATANALDRVLASPDRPAADRARDVWRHPRQTLMFFGLRPSQTVVEIDPGTGWYLGVLAPLLRDNGRYIAALPPVPPEARGMARERARLDAVLAARPADFDRVERAPFDPGKTEIMPAGSADLVLTFRNVHTWMAEDRAAAAFAAMFKALKPGGVLGVVDHRGNPQVPQDPKARSGYVNQAYAVRLAESAGFRLVGVSEINANPKDSKDHPKGVWNLPPTYADGDTERAKYAAIGESDRFTLKFIKPR